MLPLSDNTKQLMRLIALLKRKALLQFAQFLCVIRVFHKFITECVISDLGSFCNVSLSVFLILFLFSDSIFLSYCVNPELNS